MSGMFRTSNSGTNTFKKFAENKCISDYYEVKNEIEQTISAFYRRKHTNFCNECNKIKKNITAKYDKIRYCYGLARLHPIENTEKVRKFINECPNIPVCSNPIVQPSKNPIIPRHPKTDSCKGNVGCKEILAAPVVQKGEPPPELAAKTSKAKIPELKGSLEQDKVQSGEKVSSQTQQYTKPSSSSVGAHDEGSKLIIKQLPVKLEPILTPAQPSSVSSLLPSGELDIPKSEQLAPSAVIRDSHSSSSPQVEGLIKDTPAVIHPVGQAESSNQFQNVSVDGQNAHSLASDKVAVEEDFSGRNLDASLPGVEGANDEVTSDQGAHGKDIVEAGPPSGLLNTVNHERGTQGEVTSSKDDIGKDCDANTCTSTFPIVEISEGDAIQTAQLHEDQPQERTPSQRGKSDQGVLTNKETKLSK
ncbi:hypothetical protein PVC01_000027100 [Plasmodium vivax]|uniref:VIR protein n=1 Tax=Plasmodium vivax TaxID=5855 RepID=A0A1G4E1I2_PLAVI|nr:hypothetical protein PVC01_000027100 [Plasmodium vivax]